MTDGNIVSLNMARADKEGDCRLVTVKETLEATLLEADEYDWDKCLLVLHRKTDEDTFKTDLRVSGCTRLEARGLMLTQIRDEILDL